MRIARYLNATPEQVETRAFNIWIGCSLGNSYFTERHLAAYIRWALTHTREDVLIAIPDRIYAINLEVLDYYSPERAIRTAIKRGDKRVRVIEEIVATLPDTQQPLVKIARWHELEQSKYHEYRTQLIFEEFKKKGEFYDRVLAIVKANPKVKERNPSQEGLERLAEYVLYELPVFLNGATHGAGTGDSDKSYTLIMYPGFGLFDELCDGLQKHTLFPELSGKLKITELHALVEAYVD